MKLLLKALYCCPYCGSYVYAQDYQYWCDVCDIYYNKQTLQEEDKEDE